MFTWRVEFGKGEEGNFLSGKITVVGEWGEIIEIIVAVVSLKIFRKVIESLQSKLKRSIQRKLGKSKGTTTSAVLLHKGLPASLFSWNGLLIEIYILINYMFRRMKIYFLLFVFEKFFISNIPLNDQLISSKLYKQKSRYIHKLYTRTSHHIWIVSEENMIPKIEIILKFKLKK